MRELPAILKPPQPAWWRRFAGGLAIVTIAALATVAVFEVILRSIGYSAPTWYQPDRQFGWRLRPGIAAWYTSEGRAHVAVNAAGWRDGEHALAKPAGTYRIAVLGDSYAEAMQVAAGETFWARLPKALAACRLAAGREIEVMNFGVSGYGTAQEYLVLEKAALRYQPDLVLLAFTNGNDVRNNSRQLDDDKMRPFFVLAGDGRLQLDESFATSAEFVARSSPSHAAWRSATDWSQVLQLVNAARTAPLVRRAHAANARQAADGAEQGLEPVVLAPPPGPAWEEAWQISERLLLQTAELARANGARFLAATIPYAIQVHPDAGVRARMQQKLGVTDLFYPDRRIAAYAGAHGFAALPLAPAMQPLAEAGQTHFHGFANTGLGRGHWNAEGHRVAAEIIAGHLCAVPQ